MVVRLVFQAFPDVSGVEQMIHDPDGVVPQVFSKWPEFQDLLRVLDSPVVGNGHANLHGKLLGF